jgi:S-adenosylmethionine-diacylgycerolhomoserine-N-methlytransferase
MNSATEVFQSHGAAMDRMYRWQRHVYDLTRRYYLLGRDELLDRLSPPASGSVLEIGCGTGRNLMGVAKRYPGARLYGVDISQEMLKTALENLGRHQLMPRTRLACADATGFNPVACLGRAQFDRVFFSFTLSMIPDWQGALRNALGLLAPQGELHVVDFGQCEGLSPMVKWALFRWLAQFGVKPRQALAMEMRALAAPHGAALNFTPLYAGYAWIASLKPQVGQQQSVQPPSRLISVPSVSWDTP